MAASVIGNASIDDISIGSAIMVLGELADDHTMDATTGHVRIHLANLTGSVVSRLARSALTCNC